MSKLTRSQIAYDLNVSPHFYTVKYGSCELKYVFSSNLYKVGFINKLEKHREKINESLSNRFGFSVRLEILPDLKLYSAVEKRGFLIYQDGEKLECLEELLLDGNNLMKKI